MLSQLKPVLVCLLLGLVCCVVSPCSAETVSAEPNREDCEAAVGQARAVAATLPANDLSRYFAERDLHQAIVEAGNGEFDECMEFAARAADELRERRHELPPGETLKILKPDE
ncbi:hypothetical protein [Bradyrhizobium sp. Ai1a-2]|uniref:hypothetical protein n=1 Tax=Bradyrhizobium sp. Ai1a-2 TaxID=196490 RepID=UPI00042431F2|nr:hypothetical protein [Bradyrhizobium sp. Ai1a-2]